MLKHFHYFLFTLGVVSLILGFIGIFLPLLPTTPFILLAGWCFLKSSPKMHAWIYRQPLLGDSLRSWEQNGAISKKNKIFAISTIIASVAVIWLVVKYLAVKIFVTALLTFVSIFIVSRPAN